ncbi:hypothetical protein M422DRAFT_272019 [Sphaerobolus stellatus SS14]|uniref:Unplaced genomic scaffold SPHSTscaffold_279, whole genome shotgun sequence n=1 Tax=Sphaerobolus stellatus (strain SS14) TaxID=990650 RepID=A0A0C9TYG1_SPHS4|nr:hypothetical protein M422DRAFT_272019 [Sphaerobolus stellatus SS14]
MLATMRTKNEMGRAMYGMKTSTATMVYRREFHTSRPNQGWRFSLASLKPTLVFGSLKTVARIALTLLPIALIKKHMKSKWLRKLDQYPQKAKALGISKSGLAKRNQFYGRIALGLLLIPLACFGLALSGPGQDEAHLGQA